MLINEQNFTVLTFKLRPPKPGIVFENINRADLPQQFEQQWEERECPIL